MAPRVDSRSLLMRLGWPPRTRLARITAFLICLDAIIFLIERIIRIAGSSAPTLAGWVTFLTLVSSILLVWVLLRLIREKLLWRLRNRLIVTYVFIGVIPLILLVTLSATAFYLFAGQFATFIVTSGVKSELQSIEAANSAVAHELAVQIDRGVAPEPASFERLRQQDKDWVDRRVSVWLNGKEVLNSGPSAMPPDSVPASLKPPFRNVVRDHDQLLLRSAIEVHVRQGKLTVISTEPLDEHLLDELAANLGEVTLYTTKATRFTTDQAGSSKKKSGYELDTRGVVPAITSGTVPPASRSIDRAVTFPTSLAAVDWESGDNDIPALISVHTRLSVLYDRLFASLGNFAPLIESVLIFMLVAFALIELIALFIGVRLTRTITSSVAKLYRATQYVNRGDLSHRIAVESHDQLATLETSFNSMTGSLEKLLEEQKEKQRLENELVIAQEVQAQLFPKEISQLQSLEVHGFCRPARTVSGDYYDFLAINSSKLTLAVGDVSGKGISAALLMATIHSAVRAYRQEIIPATGVSVAVGAGAGVVATDSCNGSDISPAAMLALLNHQLYESTPTEKYATLFLGVYDGISRTLTYSNGGHLPPIVIRPDGEIHRLEAGGMVVGLFDNMSFDEGTAPLRPGDIFVAYSDGVTEPENDFGEFGEARLIDLVRENQHLPLVRISDIVSAAVYDWIGANEQPDDITLVLARAR